MAVAFAGLGVFACIALRLVRGMDPAPSRLPFLSADNEMEQRKLSDWI